MPHILRRFHKIIIAYAVLVEGIITAFVTKLGVYIFDKAVLLSS